MNYFAHGMEFTDRPYFLAGTAAPDWLSVVDRKVRLRERYVEPFVDSSTDPIAEFAAGVMQHFADDDRFHRSVTFLQVSEQLTLLFQELANQVERNGQPEKIRPGFLGHIVTEILLDAILIEREPERLTAYYEAITLLDPQIVEQAANKMCRYQTDRLSLLIPRFHQEQFLWDYQESESLLRRLNQVMRRVKLQPLPPVTVEILDRARTIVRERADELLVGSTSSK